MKIWVVVVAVIYIIYNLYKIQLRFERLKNVKTIKKEAVVFYWWKGVISENFYGWHKVCQIKT